MTKDVILNCRVDGDAVPCLARRRMPVLSPFLGATVLEHALAALAAGGVKRVRVTAADPAGAIRRVVGRGEAWGLALEFDGDPVGKGWTAGAATLSLESLPQLPHQPLWRSYRDWHQAQLELLPRLAEQRVGMGRLGPDVYVGLRSGVAPDARLAGPCWIGANVYIGPGVSVGAGTVIEDGCYIDRGAEIAGSVVGPGTYVGKYTELRSSFVWGGDLLNLDSGSLTQVTDPFLLGELRAPNRWVGRWARALRRIWGLPIPVLGRMESA